MPVIIIRYRRTQPGGPVKRQALRRAPKLAFVSIYPFSECFEVFIKPNSTQFIVNGIGGVLEFVSALNGKVPEIIGPFCMVVDPYL